MRHSFASICASKGIDIYRIATWLGDDVRVVQRHYAKLRPDDREIMKGVSRVIMLLSHLEAAGPL
jgi:hypothetical protein